METPVTNTANESDFLALLEQRPMPVADLLSQIHACELANPTKAEEWTLVDDELRPNGVFYSIRDKDLRSSSS